MNKQKIKAFTLVELIVVITILAILGTIAFISLSGYSEDARDSTRVSDLSVIKTSLELFELDAGKYPIPTNGTNITYSGAIVWNQGTIGETVHANLSKLDKIPKDPLTDKEYTYSISSFGNEFELGGMTEGEIVSLTPSLPSLKLGKEQNKANAGTVEAQAYTTGNYNGMTAKTLSGETCSIFSLPSIITNDTNVTDLLQIINEKRFVYSGYNNLPFSLKGTKFNNEGGFDFTVNKLITYSDTGSCNSLLNDTSGSGVNLRVNFLKNIQDSYSGTILANKGEIGNIIKMEIDVNNPSTDIVNLVGEFVNNHLGGNIPSTLGNKCEDKIQVSTLKKLNQLWGSGYLDIYQGVNWVGYINPNDYTSGLTKSQWCNDIHMIELYDTITIDQDLATFYNSLNNLEVLMSWGVDDTVTKFSLLSQLKNFYFRPTDYNPLIWNMTNLKGLYLINEGITSIPNTIGNLINLEELTISGNSINTFPNEIGNLTKLKILDLTSNGTDSIPSTIGNLVNLRDLNIQSNTIPSLPNEIGNLVNLTNLNLNGIGLTSLNNSIGNLVNLTELDISNNELTTLPSTIGNLTNLSKFYSYINSFTSLPDEIKNLTHLEGWRFSTNKVNSLGSLNGDIPATNTTEYSQSGIVQGKTLHIQGNGTTMNIWTN